MKFDKSNWKTVCLADVAYEISARVDNPSETKYDRFVGLEHFDSGELKIHRCGSTQDLVSAMKLFQAGDILLARRNVYLKRASLVEFDGICSGDAIVLREKEKNVVKGFLAFILNTKDFWKYAIANADGSMSKRINVKNLLKYTFNLPPIDDQKRIAELFWAADNTIRKKENIISDLYQLKEIVTNELIAELTLGTDEVYLGDLIEYANGQVDPREEPYNKMPLVAPNHIESNTGKLLNIETAEEQHAISGKYFFRKGNIIYSKIRPALNKVIIVDFDGLCSADMYPITPKDDRLSVQFLYYLLTSRLFVDYATMESVRTSIPKLNRAAMSKFRFSYLQPIMQSEFVQKLSAIQETIDSNLRNIEDSKELLSHLINWAMGGVSDV